jgi:hypothetical protein
MQRIEDNSVPPLLEAICFLVFESLSMKDRLSLK